MRNTTRVHRWKVTFDYRPGHNPIQACEWVYAPTKLLALWNARDQRHGCHIADPDCIRERVAIANLRRRSKLFGAA